MYHFLSIIALSIFLCQLSALELPEHLSASVSKAEKKYQRDVEKSLEVLRKDIDKHLVKFIKSYAKIEKTMIRKGQAKGMKTVQLRIKQLQLKQDDDLFGARDDESINHADLPELAQDLENAYEGDIATAVQEQTGNIQELREEFLEELQEECTRLLKKGLVDKAESLQESMGVFKEGDIGELFVGIIRDARCLRDPAPVIDSSEPWKGEPASQNGLAFIWESAKSNNIIYSERRQALLKCTLVSRDKSGFDDTGAMHIQEGAFLAEPANAALLHLCRTRNQLSIEAVINPAHSNHHGPARIISFSQNGSARNFTLGQEGAVLELRLRTPQTGINGTNPSVKLGTLTPNKESHVLISYQNGQLDWWINGTHQRSDQIQGDFSNWEAQHLIFGDEYQDPRYWAGTLRGIRIHAQMSTEKMAQSAYKKYLQSK